MDQSKNNTNYQHRILIVDDDIYTCEMYATNLRSAGYHVDIADNGVSGYQQMRQQSYDVVLLDIMLPQLQGTDILRQWRQTSPKGTKPPIIILTNYEQDTETKAELANSADAYIIKASVTPRNLRELIAKAVATC